jgi:ABC-type oligopeptide transport system substrate-binding subunit
MLRKFSLWTLILLTLFITGCNNEKGNNLYIGAEGNYNEELNLTLLNNLYIGLFEYDVNNKVTPVLAESYSYSEDGKKMYIKIKDGFQWSDGTEITSSDVAAGLKNIINQYKGKYVYQYNYLDNKKEDNISVNSEGLLEISLKKEFTDFEKILALPFYFPIKNGEDFMSGPFSGNYLVEKRSGDKIVLADKDIEKAVAEKRTETIVIQSNLDKEKLLKGYQEKDYDIIFPKEELSELKGEKIESPGIQLLWINSRKPELKNIEARKAVYHSLDKIDGLYPARYRDNNSKEKINITTSQELITFSPKILVLDSETEIEKGNQIAAQLSKKLNINPEIVAKPIQDYFFDLREGNFDLALESWEGDYFGKNAFFELFKNPLNNPLNVSGLIVPEINHLQNKINKTADSQEREVLFAELENAILQSLPAVIISEGIDKEVYFQRVKNININSIYNFHNYNNVKY